MKVAYLAAGAAGMYCGTCLHDNTLARAMIADGDDVLLVPTYTPLRTDEPDVSLPRVMLGGINMYLQQRVFPFRYTPGFVDRLLDSPWLLNWLSRWQRSVDAAKLGDLTVSILRGEDGHQRKEVAHLARWLAGEVRPDVVHLSNVMLVGLAGMLRRELGVPIVCSLSGEDVFLDRLRMPFREQARQLIQQHAGEVSAFVAMNRYFARYMAEYMAIDVERTAVIPHGLDLTGHGTRLRRRDNGFVLGYLARIHPDKGLHHLIDAFKILNEDASLPPLKLKAAGYMSVAERRYLEQERQRLSRWGLLDHFEYHGEPDRAGKIAFLQSLDVMSVPGVYRESKGLSVYEAMANAVPVVVPAHGTFPELIEDTGGGLLHAPGDPADLAGAIRRFIVEPALIDQYGLRGQQAVRQRYTAAQMAQRTRELYLRVLGKQLPAAPGRTAPQPETAGRS